MNYFLRLALRVWGIVAILWMHTRCQQAPEDPLSSLLEHYIRSLPKEEKKVFQNYRRIWLFLANTFAKGDLPTHQDFRSLFGYNLNEEKFLLRTMLTKDTLWNVYAIRCLDTLIKFHYRRNRYAAAGLVINFHSTETDSGEKDISRYRGLLHLSNTIRYAQKEYFSKFVYDLYPLPLMLDFNVSHRAKSFFFVDFEQAQATDSIYNEWTFQILQHLRWASAPLMDSVAYRKFIPQEEKNILLYEYYRVQALQQGCGSPEEDWQHRSVRPVVDAFIVILARNAFFEKANPWERTGLSPDLIYRGLSTLADQWTGHSPWLHHYITNSLINLAQFYHPEARFALKLPSGKASIRRKLNFEPFLISPIKLVYQYPNQPIREVWLSLSISPRKHPTFKVLKERKWSPQPKKGY